MSSLVLNCGNNANRAARRVLMSRRGFIKSAAGAAAALALPRAARADDLKTGLVSYWDLTEQSGTRADSHGNNDLTDNNTVGYAAEAWGDAADFEKDNNEYLSLADGPALEVGSNDFSISTWVKFESLPASYSYMGIMSKGGEGGSGWALFHDKDGSGCTARLTFYRYNSGDEYHPIAQAFDAGTLYSIVFVWDYSEHSVEFFVNGSSIGSEASGSTAAFNNTPYGFELGKSSYHYLDGVLGPTGIWMGRKLTSTDVTSLYNSGTPLLYADLVPSASMRRRTPIIW